MFKKIIIVIFLVIFVSLALLVTIDKFLPYKGEYIASRGLYHKTTCELLKYSSSKELIFYPNYQEAIIAINRPCKTCNPLWLTVYEFEQIKKREEEKRLKKEAKETIQYLIDKTFKEREIEIINNQTLDLNNIKKEWIENLLSESKNKLFDLIPPNINDDFKNQIQTEVKKQIEEEVEKILKTEVEKKIQILVDKKLEERKKDILSGKKQDLTNVEKEFLESRTKHGVLTRLNNLKLREQIKEELHTPK